jgi:hypothetical protein
MSPFSKVGRYRAPRGGTLLERLDERCAPASSARGLSAAGMAS